ncbi:MAG: integrin alpha [Reyranella sp.]
MNGDGFDDLIVGAPGNDDGGNSAGGAYVVFGGRPDGPATRLLSCNMTYL